MKNLLQELTGQENITTGRCLPIQDQNLLSPGKTPKKNLEFLTFFINTIAAVHKHADLLRASIASVNNDHRLGANEAPPAIISIFIGSQLTAVLNELEKVTQGNYLPMKNRAKLNIVGKIPEILLDNTGP